MSEMNNSTRIGAFNVDFSQVLGKGATGYVYRGHHVETFEPVAVKAIQMSQVTNEVTQYLLEGEKKAMNTIKSPFVVKTHQIVQERDYCYIVMELCSNGTLKEHIQKNGKLSNEEAIELFRKIVIGYTAVVDALFIHRDLKTSNILLRANGEPVLIDFGYCEMIMGKRPLIQYNVGSPSYMSPQAHSKNRYSEKSDIWSLGVILYEMLTGKTLDAGINIKEFFRIVQAEGRVRVNKDGMDGTCIDLLDHALVVDPERRATIHKLKYIIDKSMIPKMQAKLQKQQVRSGQQLKPNPPAQFNYGPKSQDQIKQKQFKIAEQLNLLRTHNEPIRDSYKMVPLAPNNMAQHHSRQRPGDRNQQSLLYVPLPPNLQAPTSTRMAKRSVEKHQGPVFNPFPLPENEYKHSFKRVPSVQNVLSSPGAPVYYQTRTNVPSLRII